MSHHLISIDPRERLIDRELSWLDFNERVLQLAEDPNIPLLERCRFLAIFSSNLDDFYMIRVATAKRKIENSVTKRNTAGYTPIELMVEISKRANRLISRMVRCFHEDLLPQLSDHGIELVDWEKLTFDEKQYINSIFTNRIFPILTPLAVDPSHPFPYISGLSLNLAVLVRKPDTNEELFARVKVPGSLPRFMQTTEFAATRFIAIEQVIIANLHQLFPGMEIEDHYTFRITRNADLELEEEESENLLETMEQELLRRKFGPPVRLEVASDIKSDLVDRLKSELSIREGDISRYKEPLDLTGLNLIADLDRPELKFSPFRNHISKELIDVDPESNEDFFATIKKGEILLHHPYDSFNSSVVRFLQAAASDPNVLAIKQTLYRTSGDSPIVDSLIQAAEAGKQVLAVIEIRARFDEQANVRWARKLEDVGVHVVYGLVGFKTHAKLSLVVREEGDLVRRYCHVGTGNYNPKTARIYEDLGILSADEDLGEDLNKLFNQLSGFAPQSSYNRLLVAPRTIRSGLLAKINREVENKKLGKPAFIRMKLNSLLDEEFVEAFYLASIAGVDIDLVIRGICALRPGVVNLSENIRVRSILGRFLEHSRIFHFANGGDDEIYIGSADLMDRNLNRRVESLVKVIDQSHKEELIRLFDQYLDPDIVRWHLLASGDWQRVSQNSDGHVLQDLHTKLIADYKELV
ncbi:MAG: RNA degradosome polyphosphate kinase [Actinobacteria bacterium]|nr:RNA degradosome polyphosphate kinase [Actinomycetota bacterium]NBQ60343.1 RNA degradosome polyphosphate kinase [Actinomycetota bacterium]NBY82812.1 RNA degradosome polyphosphate kinase [Actinomycetota bacterium]NCA26101.1 RNA degradosome polyphosphate kinase [Actinomycetota bacterium]